MHDTRTEEAMRRFVTQEGEVCAHQLDKDERRICTRLVRRGVLTSHRGRGCGQRHYSPRD